MRIPRRGRRSSSSFTPRSSTVEGEEKQQKKNNGTPLVDGFCACPVEDLEGLVDISNRALADELFLNDPMDVQCTSTSERTPKKRRVQTSPQRRVLDDGIGVGVTLSESVLRAIESGDGLQLIQKESGVHVQKIGKAIALSSQLEEVSSPEIEEIIKLPIVKAYIALVTKAVWASEEVFAPTWLINRLAIKELLDGTKCKLFFADEAVNIEGPPSQVEAMKKKVEDELDRLREIFTHEQLPVSCRPNSDDLAHIVVSLHKFGPSIALGNEETLVLDGEKAHVAAAIEHYNTVVKPHMEEVRLWRSIIENGTTPKQEAKKEGSI